MLDAKSIVRSRSIFVGATRFAAVLWSAFFCINLLTYIIYYEFDSDYQGLGGTAENWPGVASVAAHVAGGIGLWFLAPWLASKAFYCSAPECPKCRFSLEYFRADRCPECGIFLGEDFHAPPNAGESKPADS